MRIIPKKTSEVTLRERGLRLTGPRRVILEVVRSTTVHPSAAQVYARVRRRLPRVSLATVYRNLRLLAAEGLLLERPDVTGLRFDGRTDRHDHFTCVTCRRIFDLPSRAVAPGMEPQGGGFEVFEHRIEFYGRCPAFRRRRASRGPRASVSPHAHPSFHARPSPRTRLSSHTQPRRTYGRQESQGHQESREPQGSIRR
jgi:Fe2+ or Zn2+ uptake regulation protein